MRGRIQVNVVQLGRRKAGLEGTFGGFVVFHVAHGDLAGVEDLGPVDSGLAHGFRAFRLVFIVFCAVDLETRNFYIRTQGKVNRRGAIRRTWRYPTSKALRVVLSVTSGGLQCAQLSCQPVVQQCLGQMYPFDERRTFGRPIARQSRLASAGRSSASR